MAQHASPFFHSVPGWDVAVYLRIIDKIERRNDKDFLEGLSKIHRMLKNVDRNHILGDLREDRDQR